MANVTLPRLLIAAAIGVAYYWVSATFWGRYAVSNPLNEWLLEVLVRQGHLAAYRIVICIHDTIINLVIALPFAAVFLKILALRDWIYVALAAATAVICAYASTNVDALPVLLSNWGFWFGFAMVALALPVAFALLKKTRIAQIPNSPTQNAA